MDILLTDSKFILVIFKGIYINSKNKGNNLTEMKDRRIRINLDKFLPSYL